MDFPVPDNEAERLRAILTQDSRFSDLPYVTGPPHLRFYAGAPLINPQGYALGTICVGDFETRQLRPEQAEALRRLARQAVGQLELRRQVIALRQAEQALTEQKRRADELLLSILPPSIADELLVHQKVEPRYHDSVTVLFADFKDFTTFAENMEPRAVIDDLDRYFCAFDDIATRHGLETLKTIGDAYMAVGGLPISNPSVPSLVTREPLWGLWEVSRPHSARPRLTPPGWRLTAASGGEGQLGGARSV